MESTDSKWQMTSATGELVAPIMELLGVKLARMIGAVLCTADGFNVCSIGLDGNSVGKMSALSSSLFTISGSVMESVLSGSDTDIKAEDDKKEVVITVGDVQTVLVEVAHPKINNLVLLVCVENTSMGVILVVIRYVVAQLEDKFNQI